MIRLAEAVFDGHPDKFCDILADRLLGEAYRVDSGCYGQIEVAVWSDALWFSGAVVTRQPFDIDLRRFVAQVGKEIGYASGNAVDAEKYRVLNEACWTTGDATQWTRHVNDQCVAIGWAGYDAGTHYLPPEQFLAHALRNRMVKSFASGPLKGQGPDGKLLIRMREEGAKWILESVLVTIQQKPEVSLLEVASQVNLVLERAYEEIQGQDSRWVRNWKEVELLANPNGALLNGGSDGDNGQTGRKLVMDYYGPRVPLGGGALSGKDFSHIDRAAAYGARQAAVTAVASGALRCQVTLAYAPNRNAPLEVMYDLQGLGKVARKERFCHDQLVGRYDAKSCIGRLGAGGHFFDLSLPWNQPDPGD